MTRIHLRARMRALLFGAVVFGVGLAPLAIPSTAAAQGYGEQRTLPFRIHGSDRTTQEVYRRQFSGQASAASGNSAASGANSSLSPLKQQTGTGMNNVVQYYDHRSTSVSLNGDNSSISTGGVLNAGQTSSDTSQVLNNQADAARGGATTLPRTLP